MSRPMRDDEVASFEQRYRYQPTVLRTGIDMLAVYVNKDNPLPGLTLPQVDAIFSRTRSGGYPRDIRTWGQAGLTGAWANQPIRMYGRNAASGTYGFFREYELFRGDYKDGVSEQPGSSAVVQACASDRYGIGYSGIGYRTADVRAVPLAMEEGEEFVEVVPENAYTGEYPLARFLMVYVNHRPGGQLDPLRRDCVKSFVPRLKKSASALNHSTHSAAAGVSIMTPNCGSV